MSTPSVGFIGLGNVGDDTTVGGRHERSDQRRHDEAPDERPAADERHAGPRADDAGTSEAVEQGTHVGHPQTAA